MKLQVKTLELTTQQVKAVQNCGGETMEMTKHMPPVRGVAVDLLPAQRPMRVAIHPSNRSEASVPRSGKADQRTASEAFVSRTSEVICQTQCFVRKLRQ